MSQILPPKGYHIATDEERKSLPAGSLYLDTVNNPSPKWVRTNCPGWDRSETRDVYVCPNRVGRESAELRSIAEAIANDLFSCGSGEQAERLVLFQDSTKRNLGGLCKGAVIDRIIKHLNPKP